MSKKLLALIIVLVVIVGGYASFYAYESMVIMPEDVKVFKSELNSIENPIPESDIQAMETAATEIESGTSLTIIPADQRKQIADNITSDPVFVSLNSTLQEIKKNASDNRDIATRYDILLKGNVANDIRAVYSDAIINNVQKMGQTMQKMSTDIQNGDNAALANDYRELANELREYNTESAAAKIKLQDAINSLGG